MRTPILPPFVKFSKEGAVVGRLLAGYTQLEFDLMNCVVAVTDDFDSTMKVMFGAEAKRNASRSATRWHANYTAN